MRDGKRNDGGRDCGKENVECGMGWEFVKGSVE